jgi:hypothetical protein
MPESIPTPTETPAVHINMGRKPKAADVPEIHINMGRPESGSGLIGLEVELVRTVSHDTLDDFLSHIEAGGVFKSHGEPVRAVLKPNGMYDLVNAETGVIRSGNVPKGRMKTRFDAKITEDPSAYTY